MSSVSVYDYFDYRTFLNDKLNEVKVRNPNFSIRAFNRLSGARSTSFLKNVLEGKRNLADDGIFKMARGFRLSETETRFFAALVKFNQAERHDERDHYFQEMGRHRKFVHAKLLETSHYKLYSRWYYAAILEAVRLKTENAGKNVAWLRGVLKPSVNESEIRAAVHDLKNIGLLVEDEKGNLDRRETMLATPDLVRSLGVTNFHRAMSDLAAASVVRDEEDDREFSALTIALSERGFERARSAIKEFRKVLHSLLEQESVDPRTSVVQINLQLFRLSQKQRENRP